MPLPINNKQNLLTSLEKIGYKYSDFYKNKSNKVYVLNLLEKCIHILPHIENILKDDFDIAYKVVKQDGLSLQFLSNRMKANEQISFTAISNKSEAYKYSDVTIQRKINGTIKDKNMVSHAYEEAAKYLLINKEKEMLASGVAKNIEPLKKQIL